MLSDVNIVLANQIKLWQQSVRPTLVSALESVPDDKLDWAPAEGMMSLGNIFLHIAECSDGWYNGVMKGRKYEDLANGPCPPKEVISSHLDKHWVTMERFFAEDLEALERIYHFDHEEKHYKFEGVWIFTHLLEHDIHHRSQINQYLRILGIKPPEV